VAFRKRSTVPAVVNERIPALIGYLARGKGGSFRALVMKPELSSPENVRYVVGLIVGLTAGYVAQATQGREMTDALRDQIASDVVQLIPLLPVTTDEGEIRRYVGFASKSGEHYAWQTQASEFGLRDLCCLLAISATMANRLHYTQKQIESAYEQVRDMFEGRYKVPSR